MNPVFDLAGLKVAVTTLFSQVDANGEPISIDAPVLEVGPALAVDAMEVIKATMVEVRETVPSAGDIITPNWVQNFVSNVIVNPYIPIIATTNGDTSWCLLANGSSGRAAIEWGTLRGWPGPKIMIKAPNAQLIGGGSVPLIGDFNTGNIEYKVIHVIGGAVVDSQGGVMSDGTGS